MVNSQVAVYQYSLTRKINLKIGAAYLSRTGAKLTGKGVSSTSNTVIYNTTNEITDSAKDKDSSLYGPYNRYFTGLTTKEGVNNFTKWPATGAVDNYVDSEKNGTKNYNIKINLYNIGTWNQWGELSSNAAKNDPAKIQCFYGTTQNGFLDEDPECANGDICTGGLQYMFRQIDLTDVFPNERNPRWNWTGTLLNNNTSTGAASFAKDNPMLYDVDPVKLTNKIEQADETIYDVKSDISEIDYEFTITKEQIRNIRKYNNQENSKDINGDKEWNYLDYDMDCYVKDGKDVCKSNFLDETQYITFNSVIGDRKNIIGCNNSKSGQCYNIK